MNPEAPVTNTFILFYEYKLNVCDAFILTQERGVSQTKMRSWWIIRLCNSIRIPNTIPNPLLYVVLHLDRLPECRDCFWDDLNRSADLSNLFPKCIIHKLCTSNLNNIFQVEKDCIFIVTNHVEAGSNMPGIAFLKLLCSSLSVSANFSWSSFHISKVLTLENCCKEYINTASTCLFPYR